MRTNPSAMSEYTPPTAMPVMMSWSAKTTCSPISLGGGLRPPSEPPPGNRCAGEAGARTAPHPRASPPQAGRRQSQVQTHSSSAPGGNALAARVQVVDHLAVLQEDRRAANFLGPRQLVVVGIQFLVEEGEALDPGR